jgi:hypothetical protein
LCYLKRDMKRDTFAGGTQIRVIEKAWLDAPHLGSHTAALTHI